VWVRPGCSMGDAERTARLLCSTFCRLHHLSSTTGGCVI
jgi:hypothetical protein